ncbi:MAG: flagellar basal body rod protein FlgB [Deltaproteobacteria bacterium]|nr:flagellar basal body rod protein FlgB [Deltaproteobacteria bacterium]
MDINNGLQGKFMDRTARILSRMLDFRSASQRVVSGNLANADTPGYKPREISFDEMLQNASGKGDTGLMTTDPDHISHSTVNTGESFRITEAETDELNLETEMAKMMQNNLLYEASAKLLSKKFEMLKTAIASGGR